MWAHYWYSQTKACSHKTRTHISRMEKNVLFGDTDIAATASGPLMKEG